MKSPQSDASEPQVVLDGKYRLDNLLGEGATGVVYRAFHLGLKKAVAVKLLKTSVPDPLSLARFQREAEALGQLRHPHVVEVTDFGIGTAAGGGPYLVMELLDGITLADFCREQGPLPPEQALPLLAAIGAAVDAAHSRGILHRDLKPGNILLCPMPGGEPLVKVLDFGLAEVPGSHGEAVETPVSPTGGDVASEERLTTTGALLGTPLYVAPELIRQGTASRASDLYSFGVIAYELLAGHPPFQGSTAKVLAGHLEEEPPPGKPLPEEVWQTLQEPLRKDPAVRPKSALAVVSRLRRAAEREALVRWRSAETPRRLRIAAALSAALLLAGFLLPSPVLPAAERWLYDLRVRRAPAHAPDPRILLLTVDEASLKEDAALMDRGDEFGETLARVLAAGARGVAIDFLLPAKWADATAFSNLVLRYPEVLMLAAFSGKNGVIGHECVEGLTATALGPVRTSGLFGFVNLDEDADGVIRKGRVGYRDQSGGTRPSWAAKAAESLRSGDMPRHETVNSFWIDPRIDWPHYERISWRNVPAVLDQTPQVFRDRLVLVGGDFRGSGDDSHRILHRSEKTAEVSGLALQALLVETIAAGFPVREPGRGLVLAAAALLTGLALAWILCARQAGRAVIALAAAATFYLALSFPAFWWAGLMLPVSLPLILALLGLLLALAVRRVLPAAPEVSP